MSSQWLFESLLDHYWKTTDWMNLFELEYSLRNPESEAYRRVVIPIAERALAILQWKRPLDQGSGEEIERPEGVVQQIETLGQKQLRKAKKLGQAKIEQKLRSFSMLHDLMEKLSGKRPVLEENEVSKVFQRLLMHNIGGHNIGILIHVGARMRWMDYLPFLNSVYQTRVEWEKENVVVWWPDMDSGRRSLRMLVSRYVERQVVSLVTAMVRNQLDR